MKMSGADMTERYIASGASISPCGKYRFSLWREWRGIMPARTGAGLGIKDGAGAELVEPLSCVFVMSTHPRPTRIIIQLFARPASPSQRRGNSLDLRSLISMPIAIKPKDLFAAGEAFIIDNQRHVEEWPAIPASSFVHGARTVTFSKANPFAAG